MRHVQSVIHTASTVGQPSTSPLTHSLIHPDECKSKYGTSNVWLLCCSVFDYLNIAAVRPFLRRIRLLVDNREQIVDGRTLCIHGGLSPDVKTIDQIRVLSRAQDPPNEGAYCGQSNSCRFYRIISQNSCLRSAMV